MTSQLVAFFVLVGFFHSWLEEVIPAVFMLILWVDAFHMQFLTLCWEQC